MTTKRRSCSQPRLRLEALRIILSWAATRGVGQLSDVARDDRDKSILIADVSRAFAEAPAKRGLCVELPEEALEGQEKSQDTVGKLLASLYGTRVHLPIGKRR